MKNIKENLRWIIPSLMIGLFFGWIFFHNTNEPQNEHEHEQDEEIASIWTCSMHTQIKQNKPGLCPICAMDLVPLANLDSGDDISPNEIQMTESAAKLAEVQTIIVNKGMPEKFVYLQGKVQSDERNIAEITARFGGRIEKLFINFTGQHVKKGQKLATIYSPDLITAQKELLEAIAYKESYKSLYTAAKGKLRLWNLTDQQIEAIEEKGEPQLYFEVLSPISGTVMMRHIAIGDYVKEGMQLFRVVDLSRVWVMFDAYESDLPWIKLKDEITFNISSIPGKEFRGKISYIDPFLNAKTRVAKIRVDVENKNYELKPEMFTSGVLISKLANDIPEILIPKSSILWTGKRAIVYIKIPNRKYPSFLYRVIVLGPQAGNFYVVKSGLVEGEEIVINGVFKIDAAAQLQGLASMMNLDEQIMHDFFKVYGTCEMCKDRIEKAVLSIHGIISANWDMNTHMLQISYDEDKVKIIDVHKTLANVGHDTELIKAPNLIYDQLPECCLYERDL